MSLVFVINPGQTLNSRSGQHLGGKRIPISDATFVGDADQTLSTADAARLVESGVGVIVDVTTGLTRGESSGVV